MAKTTENKAQDQDKEVQKLNEAVSNLEKELETVKQERDGLKTQVTQITAERDGLETQVTQIKAEGVELEKSLKAITDAHNALKEKAAKPPTPEEKPIAKGKIKIAARGSLGFRRCGVRFAPQAEEFNCEEFTSEQLEILRNDPNLVVVES